MDTMVLAIVTVELSSVACVACVRDLRFLALVPIIRDDLIVFMLDRIGITVGSPVCQYLLLNTHWLIERVAYLLIAEMALAIEVFKQVNAD